MWKKKWIEYGCVTFAFKYISVYLVIYKFIYMDLLKSVYIYGPGYDKRYLMVVLLGCFCKVSSLRIIS